jgi:hypothetical protein
MLNAMQHSMIPLVAIARIIRKTASAMFHHQAVVVTV